MNLIQRKLVLAALLVLSVGCSSAGLKTESKRGAGPKAESSAGPAQGWASWYGRKFNGRRTASGERFNMHELTAAHRTLPFGSRVEVKDLRSGRTVTVKINDRGPASPSRLIDLSYGAAKRLGIVSSGLVRVEIRPL